MRQTFFFLTTKHGCFDTDTVMIFGTIHMCYFLSKLEADTERERERESEREQDPYSSILGMDI